MLSAYDAIAELYDPWSASVTEDVAFYLAETHGRWLEREPGIWERAEWDAGARTLALTVRGPAGEGTMSLAWIGADEWRSLLVHAGFEIEACYGWFDRSPYRGDEDTVWL